MQSWRPGFHHWIRKIPWRRKWPPTPVFFFGKLHGQRSLAGYSSWGPKESDTIERLTHTHILITFTIVWPQVKQQGGSTAHPENWIKDLLNTALPIRTRPSFPSVNLSHKEASISLLSFSNRGQAEWNPQSLKTNQTAHMNHSLV